MNRPALQRLKEDIKDGRVDIIVIYKIDRLTRSLSDFSELQEFFDEYGSGYVIKLKTLLYFLQNLPKIK